VNVIPTPPARSSFVLNVEENVAIAMRTRKATSENYLGSWENAAKAIINPTSFSQLDAARKILVSFSSAARKNVTFYEYARHW
jgi:hypothetical protein